MADTSHDELLSAVGTAIADWSLVELQLGQLFITTADMHSHEKAKATFATVLSFSVRVAIVDRLMEHEGLSDVDAAIWSKLSKRLSRAYKKRHELAHFSVRWTDENRPAILPFLTIGNLDQALAGLDVNHVRERSEKFGHLVAALSWFNGEALRRRVPPEARHLLQTEEPPLVVRLRELAAESLAARKHPAPSFEA
jgi:hypothetical protein